MSDIPVMVNGRELLKQASDLAHLLDHAVEAWALVTFGPDIKQMDSAKIAPAVLGAIYMLRRSFIAASKSHPEGVRNVEAFVEEEFGTWMDAKTAAKSGGLS